MAWHGLVTSRPVYAEKPMQASQSGPARKRRKRHKRQLAEIRVKTGNPESLQPAVLN